MSNFIHLCENHMDEILFGWEKNIMNRKYVGQQRRIIEEPLTTIRNVLIALGYFIDNERDTYLNPSDKSKKMIKDLVLHIVQKHSLRGAKVHEIQDRINLLKYSILEVVSRAKIIEQARQKYITIFFDYVINQLTDISMKKFQQAFETLARPILNLDSYDMLCNEILVKTSSLLQQDYCSLVTNHRNTEVVTISDYTREIYTEATHPIHWDLINKVKEEKITYIKIVEEKNRLRDYSQISCPIEVNDKVVGVLSLHFRYAHSFDIDEQKMLEILCRQGAVSIHTLKLYKEVSLAYQNSKYVNDELRLTKSRLEESNKKLMELDRLKSMFFANISHELKTPLNTIIGFSELLVSNLENSISGQDLSDLNNIHSSGKYLLKLINDILDLSKIESGKIDLEQEEIDLYEIVLNGVMTLRSLIGDKNINISYDYDGKIPKIIGDEIRIQQILYNIIGNAAKFTNKGSITITARSDLQNERVVFAIKDTGIGIKEKDYDKVFDRFTQISNKQSSIETKGSGLGMTITKELITRIGGEIWFESKYEEGSIFYFTLPFNKQNK
ncbi:MAG: hypothetical protein GX308_04320 [Epulopiscium sp.]|nr:hypothetical protein [Candidatus Epulonipiscium sp.]